MTDPLSIIGGVSAVLQIAEAITKTIKNLNDARNKFAGADRTIGLLIAELSAIKASISQIRDWAEYSFKHGPASQELLDGFRISIEGCELATQVMAEEMTGLMSNNPFLRRAGFVWNEASMREHHEQLHSQCEALKLLLEAARCYTDMQQKSKLRQPQSLSIIQKVMDDTISLRSSRAQSQRRPPSVISTRPESTIGSTIFDMDHELINSEVYQRNLALHESEQKEMVPPAPRSQRSASDTTNPFRRSTPTIVGPPESTGDSGFFDEDAAIINASVEARYRDVLKSRPRRTIDRSVSDSAQHPPRINTQTVGLGIIDDQAPSPISEQEEHRDRLSPLDRWKNEPWQALVALNNRLSPDSAYGSVEQPRPVRHVSSASAPIVPLYTPSPRESTPQAKNSIWRTLTTKASKANLMPTVLKRSPSSTNVAPTPTSGSRPIKRQSETNIYTSIDFGSTEGLHAPSLVQAAQANSVPQIERLLEQRANIEARHEASGKTALAVAAHCGNHAAAGVLLRHNADVDSADLNMMRPLHLAACRGHFLASQPLLDHHADPNAPGPDGKTALRLASDGGFFEVVELLLQYRARVNARDKQNFTALHAAAKTGDNETVKILVNNGADVEAKDGDMMAALHYTAEGDHDAAVNTFLTNGANMEEPGRKGMTPLAVASAAGSLQVVELLLSRKANTRCKADNDMLPIHWASLNGHDEIVKLLLQKKRMVDTRTARGQTPLHLAVQAQSFPVAELLLRRDADVEALCSRGFRPLHYACNSASGDKEILKLLLGYNPQIEATVNIMSTPLHLAAVSGHASAVEMLLEKGANMEARDAKGERALGLACIHGHLEVVRLLLNRGAAIQLRPPRFSADDSPLCKACAAGHLPIVREFLKHGAYIRQRDELNGTPLRYAACHGHHELVKFLLSRGGTTIGMDLRAGTSEAAFENRMGFAPDVSRQARMRVDEFLKAAVEKETKPERVDEEDPFLTISTNDGRVKYIYEAG